MSDNIKKQKRIIAEESENDDGRRTEHIFCGTGWFTDPSLFH